MQDGSGEESEIDTREESTGELELVVEGLQPFQLYSIRVAASTVVGLGPYTMTSLIEMPEAGMHYYIYHRC